MQRILSLASWAAVLALAACGGGGSDAGNATVYNLQTAYLDLSTQNRNLDLTGTGSDGNTYRFVTSATATGTTAFAFNGALGLSNRAVTSVYVNGTLNSTATSTSYHDASTLAFIGAASSDGTCESATASTAPPAAAKQGTSGALYTSADYSSCSPSSTVTANNTTQWAVTAYDGFVFTCENTTSVDTGTGTTLTSSECYEIDATSHIGSRARVALSGPSGSGTFSLVAKNY